MSVFGRHGVRCDGCGRISNDQQGYYVDKHSGWPGHINGHGRDCAHDYCSECEEKLPPGSACPKCGSRESDCWQPKRRDGGK